MGGSAQVETSSSADEGRRASRSRACRPREEATGVIVPASSTPDDSTSSRRLGRRVRDLRSRGRRERDAHEEPRARVRPTHRAPSSRRLAAHEADDRLWPAARAPPSPAEARSPAAADGDVLDESFLTSSNGFFGVEASRARRRRDGVGGVAGGGRAVSSHCGSRRSPGALVRPFEAVISARCDAVVRQARSATSAVRSTRSSSPVSRAPLDGAAAGAGGTRGVFHASATSWRIRSLRLRSRASRGPTRAPPSSVLDVSPDLDLLSNDVGESPTCRHRARSVIPLAIRRFARRAVLEDVSRRSYPRASRERVGVVCVRPSLVGSTSTQRADRCRLRRPRPLPLEPGTPSPAPAAVPGRLRILAIVHLEKRPSAWGRADEAVAAIAASTAARPRRSRAATVPHLRSTTPVVMADGSGLCGTVVMTLGQRCAVSTFPAGLRPRRVVGGESRRRS